MAVGHAAGTAAALALAQDGDVDVRGVPVEKLREALVADGACLA